MLAGHILNLQQRIFWSASLQIPLLRAAFLSDEAGLLAWEQWKAKVNMDHHSDLGSFRLLPQLYRNLQSLGIDDPLMMMLKGVAWRNWYKNQRFFRSLTPILRTLYEADIECILLNGPALALGYHSDYALGSDMNVAMLIPTRKARQAIGHVQALGWQPERKMSEPLIGKYLATGWVFSLRDATGRRCQLHWHLLPEYRQKENDADFWRATVTKKVQDVPVRILDPVDHILHSCVRHIATAWPSHFLRATDVMLILRANPIIDWDRLIAQAEKRRLIVPVLAVVHYIQAALDEPLPAVFWQRLQSRPTSRSERLEFKLKTGRSRVWRRFWYLWFGYRRRRPDVSLLRDIFHFPRYLQHIWGLDSLWQVPRHAVYEAVFWSRRKEQQIRRALAKSKPSNRADL